jgi:hypothetical protein
MSITFEDGDLTIKGSTKAQIKTSIRIAGTGVQLPITIVGDFKTIPPHLHGMYIQAMASLYGDVTVYDRTKD